MICVSDRARFAVVCLLWTNLNDMANLPFQLDRFYWCIFFAQGNVIYIESTVSWSRKRCTMRWVCSTTQEMPLVHVHEEYRITYHSSKTSRNLTPPHFAVLIAPITQCGVYLMILIMQILPPISRTLWYVPLRQRAEPCFVERMQRAWWYITIGR